MIDEDFSKPEVRERILAQEMGEFSRWYCLSMVDFYHQREEAREAHLPKEQIRAYDRKLDGLFELHGQYFHRPETNPWESTSFTAFSLYSVSSLNPLFFIPSYSKTLASKEGASAGWVFIGLFFNSIMRTLSPHVYITPSLLSRV